MPVRAVSAREIRMHATRRTRVRVARLVTQCAPLWMLLTAGCGGETGNSEQAEGMASGGAAPMDDASGGSSAIATSTGGIGAAAGGSTGGVGAYGPLYEPSGDDECKNGALYIAILLLCGGGQCVFWPEGEPPEGVDVSSYRTRGAAVLDSEGLIVEVTGFGSPGNLGSYATEYWPCYADKTIEYVCTFSP